MGAKTEIALSGRRGNRGRLREANSYWKGGRSVASNGYVLIKVGVTHHLADVRGYAYEHRLVAEVKIGRRLLKDEQVHHIDGNKQNNDPSNLEVMPSIAHHRFVERKAGCLLRAPGEINPSILCKCGCGTLLKKFDSCGRPRRFIAGHNPHPNPTEKRILKILKSREPVHRSEIRGTSKASIRAFSTCLSKMRRKGLVVNLQRGFWRLA